MSIAEWNAHGTEEILQHVEYATPWHYMSSSSFHVTRGNATFMEFYICLNKLKELLESTKIIIDKVLIHTNRHIKCVRM